MSYYDFFYRGMDSKEYEEQLYLEKISGKIDDRKSVTLFQDCFSNHVDFLSATTDELYCELNSVSRYIQKDNLSSYFINKIYTYPKIKNYANGEFIDYADFIADFSERSFYNHQKSHFQLGTNKVRYILGDIGVGKTSLIKRIISDLSPNQDSLDDEYKVLQVYCNLEEQYNFAAKFIPVRDTFMIYLYRKICECIEENNIKIFEIDGMLPEKDPLLAVKLIVFRLKEAGARLLLYIDNLDFFHYYYARYSFFDKYNGSSHNLVE